MARIPDSEIVAAAKRHGVPVGVFRGLVKQESGNQTGRVSRAGAFGPTQLMPETARGLGVGPNSGTRALLDAGARYFKQQLDGQHGNVENALRAYNAGPGAVEKSRGYAETNNYVKNVMAFAKQFGDSAPSGGTVMSDRSASARGTAQGPSDRVQQGLDVLNGAPQMEASPATQEGQAQGKLAALQTLHRGDLLGFATQIRGLRQQDVQAQSGPSEQTPFTAPSLGDEGAGAQTGGGAGDSGRAAGAVAFAKQRVGHYAENKGSNRGDELDMLQKRFGMSGQPWCAMFATTVATKGGMDRSGRTAAVAQIRQWASAGVNGYEKGVRSVRDARPGDLVMFGNNHVGVVESVGPDGIRTIEGNTRNGSVSRVNRGWTGDIARPRYGG